VTAEMAMKVDSLDAVVYAESHLVNLQTQNSELLALNNTNRPGHSRYQIY